MDRTLAETFYIMFTTRAFATGIPTALAGTPVVSAYEDNSATQITAGITLGVDHDGVTGLNLLTIVATGANGYGAGQDYNLVITTGTVGGVSVVGEVVGSFSLGLEAAFTRLGAPAGASVSADVAAIEAQTDDIGVAGAGLSAVPWNSAWDAEVQSECADALTAYNAVATTDLPTNFGDLSITVTTGRVDVDSVGGTAQTANDNGADINAILADTAEIGAAGAGLTALATQASVDTVDGIVDAILVDTGTTLPATLATAQADLDTITGADGVNLLSATQASIDAIEADTNELQGDWVNGGRLDLILDIIAADTTTDIPALIAALNDISTANVLTQVNTALDTAISELGVAAPTATPTMRTGLMLLYMMARNRVDVDTTGTDAMRIYNNAGTQIASKLITDDGTDYSEAEMS